MFCWDEDNRDWSIMSFFWGVQTPPPNELLVHSMSEIQYVIISSYELHIGHNRTDIQRPVVDNILLLTEWSKCYQYQ